MTDKIPNFIFLQSTASTMDAARTRLPDFLGQPLVVATGNQTAGRGRQGRVWEAASGNLAMTICLPLHQEICDPRLAFVAGLAVQKTLQALLESPVQIKWPNDIWLAGCKVAGLLIETSVSHVLIGIGVNLVAHPPLLTATHLRAHGAQITPVALAPRIYQQLQHVHDLFIQGGFAAIRPLWRESAALLGQTISVHHPQSAKKIRGVFIDVDLQGAAMLQCFPNNIVRIHAGDIFPALSD